MTTSAVCTLFERDYHLGVGALINSLHRHGYQGAVEVGYRGDIPAWMRDSEEHLKGTGIQIRLHSIKTSWHLTYYKPRFLLELFSAYPTLDRIFYFDPDIVIKSQWEFFEYWVEPGLALVEEIVDRGMPRDHPLRRKWIEFAGALGITAKASNSQYFNAGFVGVRRILMGELQNWLRVIENLPKLGVDLGAFMPGERVHPFHAVDQDALNIIAMHAAPNLSTLGPEGMDFLHGGFAMSHATGPSKPWRKNYLLSAIKGLRPSLADNAFWDNVTAPIPVFPASLIRKRKAMIRLARVIGRFYRQ